MSKSRDSRTQAARMLDPAVVHLRIYSNDFGCYEMLATEVRMPAAPTDAA